MGILKIKNKKIKFEGIKEQEVLIDVFLKKSVEDLKSIGIEYDFEKIRQDEDWRKYIECKLKTLMGVEKWDCLDNIKNFYKEKILDKFCEEKWLDKLFNSKWLDKIKSEDNMKSMLNSLILESYFEKSKINDTGIEKLDLKKNWLKLEWLDFLGIVHWFVFMAWARQTKGYYNLYIYKYRLPLSKINAKIIYLIDMLDIFYVKLETVTQAKVDELVDKCGLPEDWFG